MRRETVRKAGSRRSRRYVWALALAWAAAVATSLAWNMAGLRSQTLANARVQAREAHKSDVIYRDWNAEHGTVYVPVTKNTPPNPHLSHMHERDVVTRSDKRLTLMNPAYMTRQVHALARERYDVVAHITSLRPLNPANAPDCWERKALAAFEQGVSDYSSVEQIQGRNYMRFMRPLLVGEACLSCHAAQGYRLGDVRGGISTSIRMEPLWAIAHARAYALCLGHAVLGAVGLVGIVVGGNKLVRRSEQLAGANRQLRTKQRRIEGDLEAAAAIQRTLLPDEPTATPCLDVAWRFEPCEAVGGDMFNVLCLDDRHCAFYMIDVSGHGVAASLVTVSVTQALQRLTQSAPEAQDGHSTPPAVMRPADVMSELDREYPLERFGTFFTMTYMLVDTQADELRYCNAGHPPPVLMRADGSVDLLEEGGPVVGIGEGTSYDEGIRALSKGDRVALFTDGMWEQQNSQDQMYGLDRVRRKLTDLSRLAPGDIVDGLMGDVRAFAGPTPPMDDISLMVVEYRT